jgi:hypothetical protein
LPLRLATENDNDEETAMSRLTVPFLALVLVAVVGPSARAQMPAPLPAYGGFGFEYVQPVPSNSLMLDRWWMVEATPAVAAPMPTAVAAPQPAVMQPATPAPLARASRTGRSFSRVLARPYSRAGVQTVTPLPTGSLGWYGVGSVPIYSPAMRYAAYGQGYGVSPFGTVDYSAQYKGMYWAP